MFSENTEVRNAVEQLTSRAATPEVASAIVRELGWYDCYLGRGRVDRAVNTTPGNKAGGLSNIADGEATIEETGWAMFRLLLDVASGRRKTWAEHWKLHNALVLFNPAPVT